MLLFLRIEEFPIFCEVVDARPERHHRHRGDRDVRKDVQIAEDVEREHYGLEENRDDAGHLQSRLYLAEPACGDYESAAACRDESDRGDGELAEDDDGCRPDENASEILELGIHEDAEQSGEDEEFVRERVHEFSEIRDEIIFSRDLAVDHVGQRRDNEDHGGDYAECRGAYRQGSCEKHEKHGDHADAEHCQPVRQIHFFLFHFYLVLYLLKINIPIIVSIVNPSSNLATNPLYKL